MKMRGMTVVLIGVLVAVPLARAQRGVFRGGSVRYAGGGHAGGFGGHAQNIGGGQNLQNFGNGERFQQARENVQNVRQNYPGQLPNNTPGIGAWPGGLVLGRNGWFRPRIVGGVTYYDAVASPYQYVYQLPADAVPVPVNGTTYYLSGGMYYVPGEQNGQAVFYVVPAGGS